MPFRSTRSFWIAILATGLFAARVGAGTFVVSVTLPGPDENPGDGVCSTASGECTPQAAMDEANANPGTDQILFPPGTYPLDAPLLATEDVEILGLATRPEFVVITTSSDIQLLLADFFVDVEVRNLSLVGGQGADGGTYSHPGGGTGTFENVRVEGGQAAGLGGCFNNTQTAVLNLAKVSIEGCTATAGGAIHSRGTLTIVDSELVGNTAPQGAGAIYAPAGDLTIRKTSFVGNDGGLVSGAIETVNANLVVDKSLFQGNSADSAAAIQIVGGSADFGNVTFTDNTAANFDTIAAIEDAALTLNNVTSWGNDPGNGADLYLGNGTLEMFNSIVDVVEVNPTNGSVDATGYNFIGDDVLSNYPLGTGDQEGVDPQLGALQNNGGDLDTIAPLPGSPVVGAGSPAAFGEEGACQDEDARDVRRDPEATGGCDVGAVEVTDCGDGEDNDSDGNADLDDEGCSSKTDVSEAPDCSDGIDNDKDGKVDYPDDDGCPDANYSTEDSAVGCGCGNSGLFPAALTWLLLRRRRARLS